MKRTFLIAALAGLGTVPGAPLRASLPPQAAMHQDAEALVARALRTLQTCEQVLDLLEAWFTPPRHVPAQVPACRAALIRTHAAAERLLDAVGSGSESTLHQATLDLQEAVMGAEAAAQALGALVPQAAP